MSQLSNRPCSKLFYVYIEVLHVGNIFVIRRKLSEHQCGRWEGYPELTQLIIIKVVYPIVTLSIGPPYSAGIRKY